MDEINSDRDSKLPLTLATVVSIFFELELLELIFVPLCSISKPENVSLRMKLLCCCVIVLMDWLAGGLSRLDFELFLETLDAFASGPPDALSLQQF